LGRRAITKGHVYSYKIVLLEILNRKRPTHNIFLEGMNLWKWDGSESVNREKAMVDGILLRRKSMSTIQDKELILRELISMGLLCTDESP